MSSLWKLIKKAGYVLGIVLLWVLYIPLGVIFGFGLECDD